MYFKRPNPIQSITIFIIAAPIDCQWGNWEIGTCSKSNGGCTRTKSRTMSSKDANGGQCDGQQTAQEDCNANDCIGNLKIIQLFNL